MVTVCALWGHKAHSAAHSVESRGLAAALQATLVRHPALNGKQAEVDAKGYARFSARALRYPSVNAQLGQFENGTRQETVRARQPLWAFGRIDSEIAYADADQVVEETDLLRVKRQLLEKTAIAYAGITGILQRQKVAAENIASHEALFNKIARRQRGQLASETDVRLAKSRLVQARIQKERIDGELRTARAELRSFTQITIDASLPVEPHFTQLPDEDVILSLAQEQSAEVRYKNQLINLAGSNVARERTAILPTLFLQADYNNVVVSSQTDDDTNLGIILEGQFEGLGLINRGRQKAASAQLLAAKQDLQVVRNDLNYQVSAMLSGRQVQSALMQIQKESVEDLKATLSSYQRQYEAGRKAWLDVLNIQRELTEQRLQMAQSENEWQLYSLKLKALIGALDLSQEESG